MRHKYVLCRPDSGLNDIFTQIESAYRYAKHTDRVAIVDTTYKNSLHFHDKFSNYFSSKDPRLVLNSDSIETQLDLLDVVPSALKGRLTCYTPQWSDEAANYVDSETGTCLSFDYRATNYTEDILVRHTCGGNDISIYLLHRLTLRDPLVELLERRIINIGRPFSAIHIRNTDQKSDYERLIKAMKGSILLPVFVATDSLKCRLYCENVFGHENVIYFSELPSDESPIHHNRNFRSPFERNSEAILDLLTLALSNEFYKIPIKTADQIEKYSGFSNLAEDLIKNSGILISLLGQTRSAKSILETVSAWQSVSQ